MKRLAFTMIELIFVIVILGILAAVAIPKLSATRTDAKISKGMSEVKSVMSDLHSYYMSQSEFNKPSDMTNVILDVDTTAKDTALTTNYEVDGVDCVRFIFDENSSRNGQVSVMHVISNDSVECIGIVENTKVYTGGQNGNKLHHFGGTRVKF